MTESPRGYTIVVDGKAVEFVPPAGSEVLDYVRARERLAELTGYPLPEGAPTWKRIRAQAMGFDLACDALRAAAGDWNSASAVFAVPYIVNSVFCLELSFKALLSKHEIAYPREHLLVNLHALLPEAAQAEIAGAVDRALQEAPIRGTPDVARMIGEVNDGFREWRYAYETNPSGAVTLLDLRFLRTLLRFVLEDDRPAG